MSNAFPHSGGGEWPAPIWARSPPGALRARRSTEYVPMPAALVWLKWLHQPLRQAVALLQVVLGASVAF